MTQLGDTSPTGDDVVEREEKEVKRSNKSTCGAGARALIILWTLSRWSDRRWKTRVRAEEREIWKRKSGRLMIPRKRRQLLLLLLTFLSGLISWQIMLLRHFHSAFQSSRTPAATSQRLINNQWDRSKHLNLFIPTHRCATSTTVMGRSSAGGSSGSEGPPVGQQTLDSSTFWNDFRDHVPIFRADSKHELLQYESLDTCMFWCRHVREKHLDWDYKKFRMKFGWMKNSCIFSPNLGKRFCCGVGGCQLLSLG